MDQPHNRNALSPALRTGLADGLDAAVADPEVRAVVLTHTGPAFCAGADISAAAEERRTAEDPRVGLAGILAAIQDSPKPIVAPHRRPLPWRWGRPGRGLRPIAGERRSHVRLHRSAHRSGARHRLGGQLAETAGGRRPGAVPYRRADPGPTSRRRGPDHLLRARGRPRQPRSRRWSLSCWPADPRRSPRPSASSSRSRPWTGRRFEWTTRLSESLFASAEAAEGMAAFREKRQPSWHPRLRARGIQPGEGRLDGDAPAAHPAARAANLVTVSQLRMVTSTPRIRSKLSLPKAIARSPRGHHRYSVPVDAPGPGPRRSPRRPG